MKIRSRKMRWLFKVLGILVIFATLYIGGGIRVARIHGDSMQPFVNDGEYIGYRSHFLNIDRGDVILFKRDNKMYVKRVYGLPGDSVEITERGTVLINGKPLELKKLKIMGETRPNDMVGEIILESEEYFVLGDHRTVSKDSRHVEMGNVLRQEIIGISLLSR